LKQFLLKESLGSNLMNDITIFGKNATAEEKFTKKNGVKRSELLRK
jgi:hypothetical protein